jgi:hypothetical protein
MPNSSAPEADADSLFTLHVWPGTEMKTENHQKESSLESSLCTVDFKLLI